MKLTKHTRFRKEGDYTLLCRVDTLQYFKLDNKYLNILNQLKNGTDSIIPTSINKQELSMFIEDLKEMEVLENEQIPSDVSTPLH